MNIRAAKLVAAIVASLLSGANAFAAPEDAADDAPGPPADPCLTSPRDYAPPGARWRYRIERGSGRHCWFLKDDAQKSAGKTAERSAGTAEEPASAPSRRKSMTSRSVSDARAEISQTPVQEAPVAPAPPASAALGETNQPSAKNADVPAPATAVRWPEPMPALSPTSPADNVPAPAAPAGQSAEARAPAATPTAKPQAMPRAVPPLPLSEKPMSLPMLVTVIAGGLSVLGVLASLVFAWIASRRARLSPTVPMPPLELPETPRRAGDLYRERMQMRAQKSRRRAA